MKAPGKKLSKSDHDTSASATCALQDGRRSRYSPRSNEYRVSSCCTSRIVTLIGLILPALLLASQPSRPDCADVAGCRQAALEAVAQQDFERFHDLAWCQSERPPERSRADAACRTGPGLSGRPGDAPDAAAACRDGRGHGRPRERRLPARRPHAARMASGRSCYRASGGSCRAGFNCITVTIATGVVEACGFGRQGRFGDEPSSLYSGSRAEHRRRGGTPASRRQRLSRSVWLTTAHHGACRRRSSARTNSSSPTKCSSR